jgi:asparagine synthase (glutamine-hydrolysing)
VEFLILCDGSFDPSDIERYAGTVGGMVVPHASGRPWILGNWGPREVTVIEAGDRRLAVFGRTRINRSEVSRDLIRAGSVHDLDELAERIPGSVHLLFSLNGRTRSQGSVSGVRQVFHTMLDGKTVGACGIGPLRSLTGADVDTETLALRLLSPMGAPWPLSARPIWSGLETVASGHWLEIDPAGRARTHRWWRPPPSHRSRAEAAQLVRQALIDAVAARTHDRRTVSTDLSGGLDSTSLSFVAAASSADLVTFHVKPLDTGNTDTIWAERAAQAMPEAVHRVVPSSRPANLFQVQIEQGTQAGQWEGPQLWSGGWAHLADLSDRVAADGSDFHMMGFGGDTLFGAMPAYLWSLSRSRPVRSLAVVRRSKLLNRWSWAACLRGLSDRSTFAQSLAALPEKIVGPAPRPPVLELGWVPPSRTPPWATAELVNTVSRVIRAEAAKDPAPLDPDRTRHQVLEAMLFEGALVRQIRAATGGPVEWDAPFLDHQVVAAALSVRIEDRSAPGRYKPVLTTAMQGLVPEPILQRPDKGEFSAELHQGLRRNQAALLELCAGSRLAELGLIDEKALRAELLNPGPVAHQLSTLENTLACESWLRSSAVTSARSLLQKGSAR